MTQADRWLLFRRLLLLVVTASPGVQRLAFIAALSLAGTTKQVGVAAADIGIATFLALISGGAVSGCLIAMWARFSDPVHRNVIVRQGATWQIGAILVSVPVVWFLARIGFVHSMWAVLIFAFGFSAWQVERTKLLSDERLGELVLAEFGLILLAIGSAFLSANNPVLLYGSSLLMLALLAMPVQSMGVGGGGAQADEVRRGHYRRMSVLAMNGVVSSGREQLTVPVVQMISGSALAGLVAQTTSVIAALLLLPRALANNYIPELSRSAGSVERFNKVLGRYRRAMRVALFGVTGGLVAGLLIAWLGGVDLVSLSIGFLTGLTLIAGQSALVSSNVLVVRGYASPLLKTSVYVAAAWLMVVAILWVGNFGDVSAVALLLLFTVVASLARSVVITRRASSLALAASKI